MKSYKTPKGIVGFKSSLNVNQSTEGETMEQKVLRMTTNGEQIEDPAVPTTYTERKNGVEPQYDIRTDRMVMAQEAMSQVSESYRNKRNDSINEREKAKNPPSNDGEEIKD